MLPHVVKGVMPAPPVRVQLKVKDGLHRSRVVKPGDTVHILEPVNGIALDDISTFPPPHIVEMKKQTGKAKQGNQYELKVQFQTKDKQTHQAVFSPQQLLASKAAFLIGDEVIVQRVMKPVVVPVHTTGVIVGGDGDFYHVSFLLTGYDPPVTVSQDFVPAEALTYSTKKRHARGVTKLEQSAASVVGVSNVQPLPALFRKPELEDAEEADATNGADGEQVEDNAALAAVTTAHAVPPLVAKAACHLQPHVFDKFKQWIYDEHNNEVENSAHLQGLLVQFLRHQKDSTSSQNRVVNPAILIALREVGASSQDLAQLSETADFYTLSLEDALKRYYAL